MSFVRERTIGKLFAMILPMKWRRVPLAERLRLAVPVLRKKDMLRKGQEGHARSGRDVLKFVSLASTARVS